MTTSDAVFAAAQRLQGEGTPYALVSVVRALPPASAKPGDKAVVTQDGHLHGWVGGGCAQRAVVRTVRQVLSDGKAKLIRISPATEGSEKDLGDILEFGVLAGWTARGAGGGGRIDHGTRGGGHQGQ